MFATTRDLLNIVLAASVIILTVFVCWAVYYVGKIFRDASRVASSVRLKLELIDKILNLVKDKLEKGASHLGLIADSAIKLAGYFIERQVEKPDKNRKRKG